jgi:hypothetical protein
MSWPRKVECQGCSTSLIKYIMFMPLSEIKLIIMIMMMMMMMMIIIIIIISIITKFINESCSVKQPSSISCKTIYS